MKSFGNTRVYQLRVGDVLSSGATVIERPFDSVKCPRGKINVGLEYSNGKRVIVQWGKSTTVTVSEQAGETYNDLIHVVLLPRIRRVDLLGLRLNLFRVDLDSLEPLPSESGDFHSSKITKKAQSKPGLS